MQAASMSLKLAVEWDRIDMVQQVLASGAKVTREPKGAPHGCIRLHSVTFGYIRFTYGYVGFATVTLGYIRFTDSEFKVT